LRTPRGISSPATRQWLCDLCKPGQDPPYSWFPYAALVIVIIAVIYAAVLSRRDPGLGERAGSIIADE